MSINETQFPVNTPRDDKSVIPVAWVLADLPQGSGRPCFTARLVYADGTERSTAMANRTVRGLRQAVRNHPVLSGLPERREGATA